MSDADPARSLPSASLVEGARFTLQVMVPNVVQGLFRRRRRAVAAATKAGVDGQAVGLIDGIRRGHGPGPVWVRVGTERMLLALATDHVRRVLQGSPHPFAPDPAAKRRGMAHFQPDALTISRGELWENRRRFAETVLDTGKPLHRLADRFCSVGAEETAALVAGVETSGGELDWDSFSAAGRRIARRVILGDGAAADEELSDQLAALQDEANGLPKARSESYVPFLARVVRYVSAAEEGSLVGLFAQAPSDANTKVPGQVIHWLFALGDTLPANAFRALALLASHPRQRAAVEGELAASASGGEQVRAAEVASLPYLEACLEEAMRLWPTTPFLSRETLEETEWDGDSVPAGTQVLISNTFNHRDPERHEFADRFAPEAWTAGGAADDWSFNHFSHGPQGCPGAGLALFVGKVMLAQLLATRQVALLKPKLDPERPLPHMLDFFALRFSVEGLVPSDDRARM
jgi:cytochrome P450